MPAIPPSLPPWTDIVTAIAAVVALIVSFVSLRHSHRALALAELQEKRRAPNLLLSYLDAKLLIFRDGKRHVSFELSIANPSDADNAIAEIELRVLYLLEGQDAMLKRRASFEDGAMPVGREKLMAPVVVPAHVTVRGWSNFDIPARALADREVQGYEVVITDTHGATSTVLAQALQAVAGD